MKGLHRYYELAESSVYAHAWDCGELYVKQCRGIRGGFDLDCGVDCDRIATLEKRAYISVLRDFNKWLKVRRVNKQFAIDAKRELAIIMNEYRASFYQAVAHDHCKDILGDDIYDRCIVRHTLG